MGTIRFGNYHFASITGYGDYVQGNLTICHVYYVEGLGHNLFSVRHFCDGDLEVAFRSNTCYVQNLEGEDLLTDSRDSNLYTISISEMAALSLVCLMSKATIPMGRSDFHNLLYSKLLFRTHKMKPKADIDSSEELNGILSKEYLDNLFSPLYEEYYETRTREVSDNSPTNTLNNEDTPSSSSIIVEDHEAPQ
ncbi:hypothetical protein Tco_1484438 [Tanacetum coccineum]